ncbi:uncharacterized protein B0H64DRAFT_419499 [Chaetomium fimeti]|uniref:ABM domain-containing protein n=1 Tax=Chaetomium fimeti TaxID=1854472 RepID=A0AAE0H8X2_9PEZI|nr:hypothetical protein B0H64DRAFT_419499 [Chaetomium fimeti]
MTIVGREHLITWTRFYLPREQEWPTWVVHHEDVHAGPLADVKGLLTISLGRMVDNPEQAAYILNWSTLEDLVNFQSSPACARFLRNLPEYPGDNPGACIESGSALQQLTLDDTPSSPLPATSRFLVLKRLAAVTPEPDGLVTVTTFLVPHQVDDKYRMWRDNFRYAFAAFMPRGARLWHHNFWYKSTYAWFWLLAEDHWVWEKFGKPEQQAQEGSPGRTIFCHFFLWSPKFGATPEHEAEVAADPQARESWNQAIAKVMPPATAWAQERWDMRGVPRVYPPEPDINLEDPEYKIELRKMRDGFFRDSRVGEKSQ